VYDLFENPVVMAVIGTLLHITFPAIVFVISANLTPRDIGNELKRPMTLVKTFLVAFVAVPLVTAGVVKLLNIQLLVGGIMLIAAVAPGDPFDLVEARGKKGSIPAAATIMSFLVLAMPLMAPFWLWVFSRWFPLHLSVSPAAVFQAVAPVTIGPLLAGLLLHEFLPSVTRVLQRILEWFFRVSVMTLALVFLVPSIEAMMKFTFASYAAIFVAISLSLFAGYYTGGSNRKDRISLSVTSGLGNLAVILLVAHACYPRVHVLFSVFAYVIVRWAIFVFWFMLLKGRLRLRGEGSG
jgi:predicted Na+-dependent transporter